MSDQALVSQPDTAQEVLRGLRAAVPVMTGFVPVGLILGATGAHAGLSPFTSGLMCAANYAGGSEFAAVALWSTIPPVLMIMVTTWLINSRHIMLSASLTLYMGKLTTRESLFVLFFMCDEAWALAMQDVTRMKRLGKSNDDAFSLPFYVGCAIALWTSWWGLGRRRCMDRQRSRRPRGLGLCHGLPRDLHRDPFRDVAGREEVPAVDRELRRCGPHESDVLDPRGRRCRLPSRSCSRLVHDR